MGIDSVLRLVENRISVLLIFIRGELSGFETTRRGLLNLIFFFKLPDILVVYVLRRHTPKQGVRLQFGSWNHHRHGCRVRLIDIVIVMCLAVIFLISSLEKTSLTRLKIIIMIISLILIIFVVMIHHLLLVALMILLILLIAAACIDLALWDGAIG